MNGYLRQSTASQARAIGPFIDDTDFKTAETALSIANTDIKLRANGTTLSNKNSGGGTHQANGVYSVTWDATDTANVGELYFSVVISGALQVFGTYFVLEEAVYDAIFAASAPGYVTDQPVNTTKIAGAAVSTSTAQIGVNVVNAGGTAWASGSLTSGVFAAGAITATAIASDAITDAKVAADVTIASVTGSVGSVTGAVGSVTGAVGSVTGNVSGNVTGSVGSVTGNVGGNVTGSVGSVAAGGITASSIAADAIGASELAADAVAEIASGVWDTVLASHVTAGSTGAALNAAGGAGDPWITAVPGAYVAGTAGYLLGNNLTVPVSAVKTKTDQLTFDASNNVAANVTAINTVAVDGAGTVADPWGPV